MHLFYFYQRVVVTQEVYQCQALFELARLIKLLWLSTFSVNMGPLHSFVAQRGNIRFELQ